MHQEYPATAAEALAARTTDKRIPASWLCQCYQPLSSMPVPRDWPAIPGLVVYRVPDTNPSRPKVRYVVAGDPAEGNPNSDDSACHVLRVLDAAFDAAWAAQAGLIGERRCRKSRCERPLFSASLKATYRDQQATQRAPQGQHDDRAMSFVGRVSKGALLRSVILAAIFAVTVVPQ